MFIVVNDKLVEAARQEDHGDGYIAMLKRFLLKYPLASAGAFLAVTLVGYSIYRCSTRGRRRRKQSQRLVPYPTYPGEASGMRGRRRYLGLRNIGNSCYMNCVLQALAAVHDQLIDGLDDRLHLPFTTSLLSLLTALNTPISQGEEGGGLTFIDPTPLVHTMGGVLSGEQHDAHELLQAILNILGRPIVAKRQLESKDSLASLTVIGQVDGKSVARMGTSSPPVSRVPRSLSSPNSSLPAASLTRTRPPWEGDLVAVIKCTACGATGDSGTRTTAFSMLTLPVEGDGDDLGTCFARNMAPVKLTDFSCPACLRCGQCVRLESILRWPNILIIHVQRGRHAGWSLAKDERPIRFSGRMCAWRQPWELVGPGAQRPTYELAAVVEHLGGALASGHYQTYRRVSLQGNRPQDRSVQWYCCSDTTVQPVSLDQVLQAQAYLLFYTMAAE